MPTIGNDSRTVPLHYPTGAVGRPGAAQYHWAGEFDAAPANGADRLSRVTSEPEVETVHAWANRIGWALLLKTVADIDVQDCLNFGSATLTRPEADLPERRVMAGWSSPVYAGERPVYIRLPTFGSGPRRRQTAVTLNRSQRSSTCRALSFSARSLRSPLRLNIA